MKAVLLLIFSCFLFYAQAQIFDFSYRKGNVLFEDKPMYTYKRNPIKNQWTLNSLDGNQAILIITEDNSGTIDDPSDDFYSVMVQQFYFSQNADWFNEIDINPYFRFEVNQVNSFHQAFEQLFEAGLFNGNQINAEKWTNEWADPIIIMEIQSQ